MQVVYTAPNRAHHYRYALAMHNAGVLRAFVSGFSRFSPRAGFNEIGNSLHRADVLQTVYIGGLKLGLPEFIAKNLAFLSKIEQDLTCKRFINNSDIYLFYSGSGLITSQFAKKKGVITIVEAVNSHVQYQEEVLIEEYKRLNIAWTPFHKKEKARRLKEYEMADYILLPSDFVKKSFVDLGFSEEKLLKVPYGFNSFSDNVNNNTINCSDKNFTVLYVGSVSVRKGLRYLIQAFDKLEHPRKKLVIVGPRSAIDGLNDIDISSNIFFTGVLKGDDLQKKYSEADVFCLPSIEEGLALVLGEALSFGLPIIATTNTGASDIIVDGQEGYIVPIRDFESILEKLQCLADDKELYQGMRSAAISKAKKLNGWDQSSQLLISTLKRIIDK